MTAAHFSPTDPRSAERTASSQPLISHDNNFNLIRLLAATQVMIVHGLNHFNFEGILPQAFKAVPGVPVFYFISGFLICSSYARSRTLWTFTTKRVLRIYPALWVCILVSALAVGLTGYFARQDVGIVQIVGWLLAQASILQFYNPEFMRSFGDGVLNGALWTISVELQFYLLTPILFWLISRRPITVAFVFAASVAVNLYIMRIGDSESVLGKLVYVSFVPWIHMYVAGFAAAFWFSRLVVLRDLPYYYLVPAYLASMFLVGGYESNAQNSINFVSFLILAVVLAKFSHDRVLVGQWVRTLTNRADFSYGIYLYHMPVINFLIFFNFLGSIQALAATFLTTAVLAALSWFVVEKPALSLKPRSSIATANGDEGSSSRPRR